MRTTPNHSRRDEDAEPGGLRVDHAEVETAAEALRLLGDPTRLRLMRALCETELDVTSLTETVRATRTGVSQHLAKLRRVGLVEVRNDGARVLYRIRDPGVREVIAEAFRYAARVGFDRPP